MTRKPLLEDYAGEWQRAIKVPGLWLEKAVATIRDVELRYGKCIRLMHTGGSVAIAFRNGAELVIPCPRGVSEAYQVALREALRTAKAAT